MLSAFLMEIKGGNTMKDYYYTLTRRSILGENYDHDMDNEEDGICCFNTEIEANKCLRECFDNGAWFDDERHGRIRYFVTKKKCSDACNYNEPIFSVD